MKQIYGMWLPEGDTHFKKMMNEDGTYQRDTFQSCMEYIKKPKMFYDIGAHVGLWSLMAVKAGFKTIHAYEPNPKTFACLERNLANRGGEYKAHLHNGGVASEDGEMGIIEECPNNSGAIRLTDGVTKIGPVYVSPIKYLGQISVTSHECLVKIDTEGNEADCLKGMAAVIYALRPVICVEQRTNQDALQILQQMGMRIIKVVRKDYILVWPDYIAPVESTLSQSTTDSINAWRK